MGDLPEETKAAAVPPVILFEHEAKRSIEVLLAWPLTVDGVRYDRARVRRLTAIEVQAFVEEELERNPLLERDERPEPAMEDGRRADTLPAQAVTDSAGAARAAWMPWRARRDTASPMEMRSRCAWARAKANTSSSRAKVVRMNSE